MDRRHIMPQPGYDEVVTLCEVCHDFKLCLDFKIPTTLESTLPSILCEECLDNFEGRVSKLNSKEQRQLITDLLLKNDWDMNKVIIRSREIATFTMDHLIDTLKTNLEDVHKMTEIFPLPFEVDNIPEPEDRLPIRKKQADLALSLFLLQDELRARREKSNE